MTSPHNPDTRRILHIIATLDPAAGGPSESVQALLSFGPIGYTGEVLTLDDPNDAFLKNIPFPVHALGPTRTVYGFNCKLFGWLRENRARFDGVIVHGLWVYCGLATYLALGKRTRYVVFIHGMLDPYFKRKYPLKHAKKWIYWLLAEYWVLRGAYCVLFTTEEESRLARETFWLHRWKGFVVPFGARRPPGDGAALRENFYGSLPELRGKRIMLFLGRIHRKKGCDLLIHAFIKHAALDPDLHLVMAGPDQQEWSASLKQIVLEVGLGHRVHWPGMLRGNVKWGAFFASEVFVLPSHQENFGIAVAEALGCGIPVLLADKVNIASEIAADGAGLIEPDTQPGTDSLLLRWMQMDPRSRAAMQTQAHLTFDQRYDMRKNALTIVSLFDQN